ncbi:MAG: hypothetical protein ACYC0N_00630 [Carboxydocellales bacterium]
MTKVELTELELKVLHGARNNHYSDIYESSGDWTFAVIDAAKLTPQIARGVISSLIKKGLATVYDNDGDQCFSLTAEGKKACDDYKITSCWG